MFLLPTHCKCSAVIAGFSNYFLRLFSLFAVISLLSGCASSDVSRDAATNVDVGVRNARTMYENVVNTDVVESYQIASQAKKGAILGGAAGAIAGGAAAGVGAIPGGAVGAVLGASYGMYVDTMTGTSDQLTNRGANIVVLGDQILIMIPSARLFQSMTSILKTEAYSTLGLVARYINRYTKTMVRIAAYTNPSSSSVVDLQLSKQQAEAVARFLTMIGVNARLLYAVGCGGSHPIANTANGWNESDNYRIEVTFEKLYV